MIIDLERFLNDEKPFWEKLETTLERLEKDPEGGLTLEELKSFHYCYQRASADLARMATFGSDPDTHRYLESLVARAYGESQEIRQKGSRFFLFKWVFSTFPDTFRCRIKEFSLALAITLAGFMFGGLAVMYDSDAKEAIMPFANLIGNPAERVSREESAETDRLKNIKIRGAASYMTHNTRVAISTAASGISWGAGTVIFLFYNGVILGGVVLDYILAGKVVFLLGWLMPHGVIEIPAILIAGQAGFVIAGAMIGRNSRVSLRIRLKIVASEFVTLCFGAAILLIWAGFIESFLSQYHQPVVPYALKIGFGTVELFLLILFLSRAGVRRGQND
jgi:uncharacterized membrane protein SpoIIM required for sporulation